MRETQRELDTVNNGALIAPEDRDVCQYCELDLEVIPRGDRVQKRISLGFGHNNKEMLRFCSKPCRARFFRRGRGKYCDEETPWLHSDQTNLDDFDDDDGGPGLDMPAASPAVT
ncbi:hypothetical protein [Natronosalvus rutilus]|uniref:MYM-type domain-containing protein n=1 Tax=Natronosalvus rutilus TaxID=2953753 RepID=A0A9E7NCQ8_9EURY|nr:hypothetical protein [Natronosalvus rutilus]UTF56024.1 hypothetical protein NGM29_20775 [Natronosalvus rutilus]